MNIRIVAACLVIGAIVEALSYWRTLWIYQPPWLRSVATLIVYGGIVSWMSTILADQPAIWRFAAGAVFGVIYEAINLIVLRLFTFPNQRLLFLRGTVALIFGAGLPWGLLPLAAPLFK